MPGTGGSESAAVEIRTGNRRFRGLDGWKKRMSLEKLFMGNDVFMKETEVKGQ